MKHISITPLQEMAPLFVLLDIATKDLMEEAFALGETEAIYQLAVEKVEEFDPMTADGEYLRARIDDALSWNDSPSEVNQVNFEVDCMTYFLLGCPK